MIRSSIYGRKSAFCPVPPLKIECYEPCEHTSYVFENSLEFIGDPFFLESLLRGQLAVAENFLAELCLPIDICKRGESLGFPCVQCDFVLSPKFSLCANEPVNCGNCSYAVIDPCLSLCADLCSDNCVMGLVDFSTAGEPLEFYATILNALVGFSGNANWNGINQMAQLIFGNESGVVLFRNGTYYINVGDITDFVSRSLHIIKKIIPLPIGANVEFVSNEVCT